MKNNSTVYYTILKILISNIKVYTFNWYNVRIIRCGIYKKKIHQLITIAVVSSRILAYSGSLLKIFNNSSKVGRSDV
jgi:hypothetical protein